MKLRRDFGKLFVVVVIPSWAQHVFEVVEEVEEFVDSFRRNLFVMSCLTEA